MFILSFVSCFLCLLFLFILPDLLALLPHAFVGVVVFIVVTVVVGGCDFSGGGDGGGGAIAATSNQNTS